MRIMKVNICDEGDTGGAVVRLSRKEIGIISTLMSEAQIYDNIRSQFFLLYELVSHGSFDLFDMQQGQRIMLNEKADGEEEA